VTGLVIRIEDLPPGAPASIRAPERYRRESGHYLLVGDPTASFHPRSRLADPVVISRRRRHDRAVLFESPDDRFTLTISEDIVDPAWNHSTARAMPFSHCRFPHSLDVEWPGRVCGPLHGR
jgi:hypothetical protein